MKLIIQVPCLNEEDQLPITLSALPRDVPGFDVVEWLLIDDGSTDATIDVARRHGVDHIVALPNNRGLATAFQAGLDAAVKLGADVVVNTDADNQYSASSIAALVAPIVAGEADMVIGDRDVRNVEDFSFVKRRLQVFGSWVVRVASDTKVPDTTSGFRAYSREAALQLTVVNRYTYTIESIIQAGKSRTAIAHVPVDVNPKMRESRLFGSSWGYIRRSALTIGRVFAAYEPLKFFGALAAVLAVGAAVAFSPFLWDWLVNGNRGGHVQSIILGAVLALAAVQVFVLAIVADLIAAHRTVTQRILERVRRLEVEAGVEPSHLLESTTSPNPPPDRSGDAGSGSEDHATDR